MSNSMCIYTKRSLATCACNLMEATRREHLLTKQDHFNEKSCIESEQDANLGPALPDAQAYIHMRPSMIVGTATYKNTVA